MFSFLYLWERYYKDGYLYRWSKNISIYSQLGMIIGQLVAIKTMNPIIEWGNNNLSSWSASSKHYAIVAITIVYSWFCMFVGGYVGSLLA